MDAEGQFFAALLRGGELSQLRQVSRDHLAEQFHPVYDYLLEFMQTRGQLPRFETVSAKYPNLLPADSPEDVSFYADAIRQNAMRLAMEDGFTEHVVAPLREGRASQSLAGARHVVSAISKTFRAVDEAAVLDDISEGVATRMRAYRLRKKSQGAIGIPTPWAALTRATGGLQGCDACALLARPAMGKTFVAVLWAVYLWQLSFRVLFASMETPPRARKRRDPHHRVVGTRCLHCYERGVLQEDLCPAADVPPERLSIRFDAIGSRLSAWRLYKGWLTPQEERTLERYYAACETRNNGKWGDLKIVAPPHVSRLSDLEMEILTYQPDIVFWDSAYLAAEKTRGRENKWTILVQGFKQMLERVGIPGVVTWHFNRDVTPTMQDATMGAGALTDELPRACDIILGLFRPPDLEEAGEAILRGLKTRDGLRLGALRTHFQIRDHINFSEIGDVDGS